MEVIPAQFKHDPVFSIMLSYSDLDKVAEIDHYYQNLLSLLNLSERLDEQEKLGQHVFLAKEWEKELTPLLNLISINIYGSR